MTPKPTEPAAAEILPVPELIKGVNLRPVGDERRGYGTTTARETLMRLKGMGVNTIGVLMEGRMASLSDTQILVPPVAEQKKISEAIKDAAALGFATILVPHIYTTTGQWRGDLVLSDAEQREAWWQSYTAFMDVSADIAAHTGASALSIGVELKGLSKSEDTALRMRALAARVRRDYSGVLTYSANWDEAESVAFWDAVDLAGVNGYYPLLPDPLRGAEQVARRLQKLAEIAGREVVVLEVGYRSSPMSHVRPWEWPGAVEPSVDDEAQARAWAAILTHWMPARGVRGIMAWVIPTDPDDPASEPRHGFNPLNKPAEQVIARAFGAAQVGP